MNLLKSRALTLLAATALAAAACQGSKGADGAAGASGASGTNGTNGTNGTDGGSGSNGTNAINGGQTTGLVLALTAAPTVNADNTVSVRFTAKDDQGFPVDLNGKYSTNTVIGPRFALAYVTQDAAGNVLPYTVLTGSTTPSTATAPPVGAPATASGGQLVENGTGAGDYTYTFPATVTVKAPTASHALWIQATRQTNLTITNDPTTFKAVNFEYDFIPGSSATPLKREIVKSSNCSNCHNGFKPQGLVSNGFHGGGRVQGPFCNVCHNPAHGGTLTNSDGKDSAADSAIFVHRIHAGKTLTGQPTLFTTGTQTVGWQGANSCSATKVCTCTVAAPCAVGGNLFHNIGEVTYPQDFRNCGACHAGAAQGAQSLSRPTRAACGSCHDNVDFSGTVTPVLPFCKSPMDKDANGRALACVHFNGVQADDTACAGCHTPAGNPSYIEPHVAVAPIDAGNIFIPVTTGNATAGYQGGTLTACTVGAPCTCNPATPCFDPVKLSSVTTNQTSGSILVGGAACGSGHQPSLYTPCTCTLGSPCLGSGNNNTNAAALAATGVVPTGANKVTYDVKSVSLNAAKNPVIAFKLKLDGADVAFNAFGSGKTELIDNFVGSPSVYFAYALPQDGITAPADFNATANAYIKGVWNAAITTGTVTTGTQNGVTCTVAASCTCTVAAPCYAAGANTMTGPDSSGYYTITIAGTVLPATATMLTGGVGYTYGLTSTQPLTQTNVTGYPYDPPTKQGGVLVSALDQAKPATGSGFTKRRAIVDTAKCNNCHAQLGAEPTFHAGQRNDGPTCSFCHTPNKTSSGWSANAKDFIHSVHAGNQRSTPFTWHATSATEGFWDITFPGQLNYCEACHAVGVDSSGKPDGTHMYDFSNALSAAAIPNLLPSYVGTGKYNGDDTTANIGFSPWVSKTTDSGYATASDYGYLYATNDVKVTYYAGTATSGKQGSTTCTVAGPCTCTLAAPCIVTVKSCTVAAPCNADDTTLVISPITAACVACHDDAASKAHMVGNGASFYVPRSAFVGANATNVEQCLICHGPQPDAIAPIASVHK